jgi:hypothetical protein
MAQGKVTDFFATRKRNRFNQDEILLNKQKKTHTLIDPTDLISIEKAKLIKQELIEITTRSKSKLKANQAPEQQQEQNSSVNAAPEKETYVLIQSFKFLVFIKK